MLQNAVKGQCSSLLDFPIKIWPSVPFRAIDQVSDIPRLVRINTISTSFQGVLKWHNCLNLKCQMIKMAKSANRNISKGTKLYMKETVMSEGVKSYSGPWPSFIVTSFQCNVQDIQALFFFFFPTVYTYTAARIDLCKSESFGRALCWHSLVCVQ